MEYLYEYPFGGTGLLRIVRVYLNRGYDLVRFKVETVDSESTVLIDPHCQIWSDWGIPLPAMLTEADRVELLRCILKAPETEKRNNLL